jgi:spore maturation protein CgeB
VSETTGGERRLVIVGFRGETHVGSSFARAANRLGLDAHFVDAHAAFAAPRPVRAFTWRLLGHRPPRLDALSQAVLAVCERWRPRWLLTTGLAPVDAQALASIGRLGVSRVNYLTDDPWNPAFRAGWFFEALRQYDQVYTPRRANLEDLTRHGCTAVAYVPFGFDPDLSFRQEPATPREWSHFATDVAFVGGADRDRVPYIRALLGAGVRVGLYGGYWERFRETRQCGRGHADLATVRKATSAARVSLCLVRRANRDGHVMRSLEIPAMGGCMLAEDTDEHRALLGPPGDAAAYFRTIPEMLEQLLGLLAAPQERQRLSTSGLHHIQTGHHTYADRLRTMLESAV